MKSPCLLNQNLFKNCIKTASQGRRAQYALVIQTSELDQNLDFGKDA